MGLKITTITRLPPDTGRDFFIYFLDYGWDNELTDAMYANFDKLAAIASDNRSLLLMGLNRQEFANEVLSWHHINNDPADDLLPAILITDVEPQKLAQGSEPIFHETAHRGKRFGSHPEKFVLIPLRDFCTTQSDVTNLLNLLARDLVSGRTLSDFEVKRVKSREDGAAADMIVLQPNIAGIGVDLKEIWSWSKQKLASFSANRNTSD